MSEGITVADFKPVKAEIDQATSVVSISPEDFKKDPGLETLIRLVTLDALHNFALKARGLQKVLKERHENIHELHKLMQAVNCEHADLKDGTVYLKDKPELKKMLERAHEYGIKVPGDGTSLTKEQREALIRNLDAVTQDLQDDQKQAAQDLLNMIKEKDTFFEGCRSISDTLARMFRKISDGIR